MRVDAGCRWLGAVVALLLLLLVEPVRAQSSGKLPEPVGRSIQVLLAQKAQRTPAQRKLSSQLLDAAESAQASGSGARRQARDADAKDEVVTVDIRADVTPAVLARIRALGGTVINSVPKYRAIRAELPVTAIERLAALAAVQTIRPADEAVTRKVNTTQGDTAHRANTARTTYSVDGTGIGIGVISDGVRTLAARQASGDVSAQVTVLPGQAGAGDEGTALLEIVHDLAPGAELYFATGNGGQARMAANIEALCEAGANVIVDDIGYLLEAAFQDDIVAQGVNAAVADGCVFFSAGGNDGNLTNRTSGVWEGDYAAGSALVVDGQTLGTKHDFGGGVEANELEGRSVRTIILQWADPLGDSSNDYDLFLVNENGAVLASSTDTQDGTQDPIEVISSPIFTYSGLSVVVVKASGANRYLRVQAHSGPLAVATAGTLYGHSAQENAISVAMVDVATAGGSGGVFDGTESVHRENSDGPRRIFFEADGTAITSGNFSATGGKLLQKPDLTAATCVTTATPGFSRFCGTSAAAPHAAAIGALMLEAAGGPEQVTLAQLRTAMTGVALDIEATGVDRDSGAGIVMAPGAVDAVDVAKMDRNAAPTVSSTQNNRTFAAGAAAVTIDLANVFDDQDDDTLTYEAVSSDPDRLAATQSGSMATITPGSPGHAVVTLRAIDPDGLSAVETFAVTVTAGNRDYDADNDGLIDVGNLAQLDAMRYDLNGDGLVDGATWMPYYSAYPMGSLGMGCPSDGCTGYELTGNLDFDTNGDGRADMVGDTYWNAGAGWEPIGEADDPFTADFAGDGHTIANLFIDRETEDGVGLFGASNRISMHGIGLVGVDVTGGDRVGGLLGHGVFGAVVDSSATGRVSGTDEVGGLVGRTWGRVRHSYAAVNVSGADAVGGLVGHQLLNDLDSSYATGNVEGMNAVGGLVGAVSDRYQVILASYATGDVSGGGARLSESDSGFIICDGLGFFTTFGPVETPTSSGGGVGGLVGSSCGVIEASYATGAVSGDVAVGGLVGSGQSVRVRAGYWDLETSGVRVGVGEDDENDNGVIDGTESQRLGVGGKTTAELQTPTDYTGIYAAWNVDLWNFGTSTQYPALSLDLNDDNRATWQEFGYQVRDGLTLTATTTESQAQVVLSWNAVSTSPWNPDPPDVSYTLYRDDGTTVEAIAENLTGLSHTDTNNVMINDDYTYWVAAVVDGGEAVRSAPVVVIAGAGNQPPVAVGIVADRELLVGATAVVVDVARAFDDPDDDTLTYAATSSRTSVATLSRSGSMITITPASAGRTIITVTATDAGGSNTSVSQRFTVTVGHNYDADEDGLIAISNLAQLHAMRHDLDGNGVPVSAGSAAYAAAFPDAFARLGCGIDGCSGYELTKDLDFDTDGDGSADAGDTYWNAGEGWEPIGLPRGRIFGILLGAFNATFDGNGHSIANLFVARDDHSGLFGAIRSRGVVRDVRLTDVDVTGKQHVGGLAGENHGVVSRVQSAGQVSGEVQVGGLVGGNLGTITLARSSAAVTGMAPPDFVRTSDLDRGTGGLVGYNGGAVRGSYATGRVVGDSNVGGLVGWNFNDGFVGAARSHASIVGSYATGSVAGRSSVGGLVGTNGIPGNAPFVLGEIKASYATGRVSGPARGVGGLVGYDSGDDSTIITASYWDTNTSGQTSGSFGIGRTTAQLKAPTGYSGIFGSWNVDLDDDGRNNDPWHFRTGSQYPVLKANVDGQGAATWQEFGYQLRSGPTLMTPTVTPTMTAGQAQVDLDWTAVDVGSWTPPPDVTYTVTRADGDTVEILEEGLGVLLYTDSAARTGATLSYQVIAVVDGGEPVRSAVVEVTTSGNSPPLPVGTLSDRWLHAGDAAGVEVGKAFEDPEGDTLTYTAASSATGVVTVSVSGSRVTITPVAAGTATITVTATDAGGSMAGGTQTLTVTVQPSSAFDYDMDDDGLIEITELEQLDAMRHDLNGDGVPTTDGATAYAAAFSTVGDRQACGGLTGCVGYELADNLDFDTNGDGLVDENDDYWNAGAGWEPIKAAPTPGVIVFGAGFRAIFEGNGHTIANLFIDRDSNVGLFGRTSYGSVIRHVGLIDVMVSGSSNVGGLAGTANGSVIGSYVTGTVTGTGEDVGGLAGATWGSLVVANYAAVEVTGGNNVGGLIGENDAAVTASYATGWVAGDDNVGGLVGSNGRTITASYATGPVTGVRNVGGLVGRNTRSFGFTGTVTTSYWDTATSRRRSSAGGQGRTTGQLQTPTGYSGIYAQWNVDLDGDSTNNDPWHFDTGKYPALQVNVDGQGTDWKKFGYQLRAGPTLTATGSATQVDLSWTAVDTTSHWTPAPDVTYIVYRNSGSTVSVVAENISGLQHTTTGVTDTYQVSAVVTGGEAVRSGWRAVVAAPNQPPTFDEGDSTTRSVPENTPAGRAIGMPVVASDADNDRRTYSLGGDDAADFSINTSTGQLQTKAGVTYDYETKNSYRVTVSVHDGKATDHTPDTTIDTTIDVTITLTDVNDPAMFPSTETGSRRVNENTATNTATGQNVGDPVAADDDDGDTLTYSLSGTDENSFTITSTGQLRTAAALNYETKTRYTVTVAVRDSKNDDGEADTATDDTITVTITVVNEDEAGTVTISGTPPRELHQLTAALSDLDGGLRGIAWQWARSVSSAGPWTDITGATATRYTPGAADVGQYLQASATYTDGQGSGKRASQATTTSVQAAPQVTLHLSDTSISEDGTESSTVTATLDTASSAGTTVTVSAPASDVALSSNRTLTITVGERESTGEVTLTAKDNNVDGPERKTVQVSGTTSNRLVAGPDPVNLTIVDDDAAPEVTLVLSPGQIDENNKTSTVMATLNHPSSEATTVQVSAVAVHPAVAGDFTLSPNTTLAIPAGQTTSSGTAVTLTSVKNDTDAPNKQVTVSGRASNNHDIAGDPADATLSITDDDPAPTLTLVLMPKSIGENSEVSTLTVTLDRPSSANTTVTISADPAAAVTLSSSTLTIPAGEEEGTVTLTAVENTTDAPDKQVTVRGEVKEEDYLLGPIAPATAELTVTDNDNPPEVTLVLSENEIDESGGENTVTVRATLNRESSQQIVVTVATASAYTLSAPRTLTIPAGETESEGNTVTLTAKDNDLDADNATVMVSGTTSPRGLTVKAAALTIRDDDTRGVTVSKDTLSIREDETATYTVVLDSEPTVQVTVKLAVEQTDDAVRSVSPEQVTFTTGNWDGKRTVTVRADDDDVRNTSPKTATITHTVTGGDYEGETAVAVSVTVTDDESPSTTVTLRVNPDAVTEGTSRTVTVTGELDGAPEENDDIDVSVTVTSGTADQDDFNAAPVTLTIREGGVSGTVSLTLTDMDDGIDEPDEETVTVSGTAVGTGLTVTPTELTIRDNDNTPTVTLVLTPDSISEDGEESTVTATLSNPSSEATTVTVLEAPAGEYRLSRTSLTIPAEATESRGEAVALTAEDNDTDDSDKQVRVSGRAENDLAVNGPAAITLTITDDDPPEVEGEDAPAYVEGGRGPVATYTASNPDPRTISIRWGLEGADKDAFTISNGILRFTASPDYEDPTNLDREYAVTVQASDGTFTSPGLDVLVTVEDALGMVRLSSNQPQVGSALTATVRDNLDDVDEVTEWCWEWSSFPAFPPADTHRIACLSTNLTTTARYTPVDTDLGRYLRATARYTDGQETAKTEPAVGATTRTVSARRRPPPPPPPPPGRGGGGGGGGGPACAEDLHGNSAAQSTDIALSAVAAGAICPAADVDYFTVTAPGRGLVFVDTPRGITTRGTIWQDGTVLVSGPVSDSGQAARLGARVQAGPVVIALQGQGGATGTYAGEITFVQGYLENPGAYSFQSGVGVLSGWVCDADMVEIELNGIPQEAAYGTERLDTLRACGDTDNGFGLLFNWNLLVDGDHTVVAFVDGVELGRAIVMVTTLGQEFLRNVTGTCEAEDFPTLGERVTLVWQQNSQNFVIAGGSPPTGATPGRTSALTGFLENPGHNSFQSGVRVLSGWVCDSDTVELEIGTAGRQVAAYGTERLDTQGACGDTDNGFGLLFNWNLLGEGEHDVVAFVDDVELGRATVQVTTLGQEFLRGVEGECVVDDFPRLGQNVLLEWQQNSQNFVITDVE